MTDVTEQTKQAVDVIAIGGTIGALIGWLPAIAAGFTIVWTVIRIYETKTVKNFLDRWNAG